MSYFSKPSICDSLTTEVKYHDSLLSEAFTTTGTIPGAVGPSLCQVPRGFAAYERLGRQIIIRNIRLHGVVASSLGALASYCDILYMYIILDKQCNGASPAVAGDTGIFTTNALWGTTINMANADRFVILHEFIIPDYPSAGAAGALNDTIHPLEWSTDCHIPIEFDSSVATGALTSIRSNNILLVIGSANHSNRVVLSGRTRIRFTEDN